MRLKTFLASYLLFLVLLFGTIGVVSVHLTNSQMNMLKTRSLREYQTISISLANDMGNLGDLEADLDALMNGYIFFYSGHHIHLRLDRGSREGIEASFVEENLSHFVRIMGALRPPFGEFQLVADFDITDSVVEMQSVQRTLLLFSGIFSLVGAVALHVILSRIFKPLSVIAKTASNIANGDYEERILVTGSGELSLVATDFNRMAEEIQKKIVLLEEEALQKQQFVDNFAHEIRTPLTSIFGYAQYLQTAALEEEELYESTAYIMEESAHMQKIANSLLELATLRNFTPVMEVIDLEALLQDVLQTLEPLLLDKQIHLTYQIHETHLLGQYDLIKSVLLNLCSNATKACGGNGEIQIDASATEIVVTDNGHGIPKDSLTKLTEPFYRVDKARSRDAGGIGLGLALVQQIMDVHHGQMSFSSIEGQGTSVTLNFPKEVPYG